MFGVSLSEIILILVISLVVLGPEQLPQLARKFGQGLAYWRQLSHQFKQQLYQQSGLEQIQHLQHQFQDSLSQLKHQLTSNHNQWSAETIAAEEELEFLHQPELDFNCQPELFDEIKQ